MTPRQKQRVASAIEKGVRKIASDQVVYVDAANVQTGFVCLKWNVTLEGLDIDAAGLRPVEAMKLMFLKTDVATKNVKFSEDGHFLIGGFRWDFMEGQAMRASIVPIGGIHNIIEITVRRAIETEQSTGGSEIAFDASSV